MRLSRETPRTRFDTFTGGVNNPEFLTIIFKVMRPSSKAGRDLHDCFDRQAISNTRQDGAGPLRGRIAPGLGPFLPCIFPVVFHQMARVRARTNRLMMFKSKIVAGGGIEPPTIAPCGRVRRFADSCLVLLVIVINLSYAALHSASHRGSSHYGPRSFP